MTVLAGLCVFMAVVLGIMLAMALAARGIAEDQRKEAKQAEKEEQ